MSLTNVVLAVAIVALVLVRQLAKRSVAEDSKPIVLLVLLVLGVLTIGQYLGQHPVGTAAVLALAGSLIVGATLGVVRAYTVRLWRENGTLYRQGTLLTLVLWLVSIGAHIGIDMLAGHDTAANGLASASILLFIAISFGVQRQAVLYRARRQVGERASV
ncbi:MAG TPA: hypothetical protein VG317_15170 [Pseudonocardiaceae bacterium]|jgi:hypothetical protein|nr:hypothetical protein [Pseudonocardiaceae bacterium]